MKVRNYFLIMVAFCTMTIFLKAGEQYQASVIWPLSPVTLTAPTVEGYVTADDEAFVGSESGGYTGPNESQRVRIIGNSWPANLTGKIDDVYVQFEMAPQENSMFLLDSFSIDICGISANTMKAEIFLSNTPDFSTFDSIGISSGYLVRDEMTHIQFTSNITIDNGEKLYIRMYPWIEDPTVRTGKYVCIQNVKASGKIETLASPASAEWYVSGEESPVITGGILAGSPLYSDSLTIYSSTVDKTVNQTLENVTCAAIHSVSKVWFAETDTVSYFYFGTNVSPKTGGTFHIDSVQMNIGGWFASTFKAAVYYSTNSDFSDATLLIDDTSLDGTNVDHWKADLDTNIATGETFYLRIYPHNTADAGWAKLIAINSLGIFGSTTGVTADPPEVTTEDVSYISTTYATCGGTIVTDGGSIITERGVVWNLTGSPTTDDNKTSDGTGSGTYKSLLSELVSDTVYYVRAYATNKAGTSYGSEKSFRTLSEKIVPVVSTTAVTSIVVKSAISGGNVTDWGGDTISARGVCWNTTGNPTIADSYVIDGKGLGSFTSSLYPLTESTLYYVRSFATNSIGTGYGNELSFTTQAPAPDVLKVVDKDGAGDYTTVQAAFDDVPDFYTGNYVIQVNPGTYYEKLILAQNKVNVTLKAVHPDSVILTYDDYAGKSNGSGGTIGTSGSYSTSIEADDFTAINITFENTIENDGSFSNQQAVALRTNGDRQSYYHCKLTGFQDTYYTYGLGRVYMKNCHIDGTVDFIFGKATVVFDSCDLKVKRQGSPVTAASTEVNSTFGYVFRNCRIYSDKLGFDGVSVTNIYLGRPWQGNPKVVYMNCYEPSNLASAGWTNMSSNLSPLFAEYNCYGPGYKPESRSTNKDYPGIQLTGEEANEYTIANIFAKSTNPAFGYDWMPDTVFTLKQNQEIDFGPLAEVKTGDAPFALTGTSSSGLEVIYSSSNTSVATINEDMVTIVGEGTTTITASQTGNYLFNAASDVAQDLVVKLGTKVESLKTNKFSVYPNPSEGKVFINIDNKEKYNLSIYYLNGQKVIEKTNLSGLSIIDLSSLNNGIYYLVINGYTQKLVINN